MKAVLGWGIDVITLQQYYMPLSKLALRQLRPENLPNGIFIGVFSSNVTAHGKPELDIVVKSVEDDFFSAAVATIEGTIDDQLKMMISALTELRERLESKGGKND